MPWMYYNPQRADAAVLDGLTRGASRIALLDELLGTIRAETGRETHQAQLLLGPRGAGKTHLLRVLVHRLREDPAMAAAWWPVVLPEEVASRGPAALLGVVVDRLAAELTSQPALRSPLLEAQLHARGRKGDEALEIADEALRQVAKAAGRTLLVVVENLDGVLWLGAGGDRKRSGEEQWALRKRLQRAAHLMLLGAAPTRFGAASDPGAAFHGFFRDHSLEGLSTPELMELLDARIEHEAAGEGVRAGRARDLAVRMGERRGKLAGILRLTGGLPRFVHLVVDLLFDIEDADIGELLDRLLDEQTPLFQSRLDPRLVPPQELDALAELARADGPLRPAELARRLGWSAAEVSVILERLRERGLARRAGKSGSAVSWDVGEPLYRVWMAFREGGAARTRMEALAGVVAALWNQGELAERKAQAEALGERARAELLGAALVWKGEVEPAGGHPDRRYGAAKERAEAEGAGWLEWCTFAFRARARESLVEALAASGRAVELATTEVERGFALVAAAQSARGARKWTEAIESAERAMGLLAPDPRAAVHAEIERSLALAESGRGKEALDALDAAERRTGVTTENPETAAALRLLRSRWTDDWSSVDEIVSMDIHGLFAAQARWFAAHSRAAKGVLDRPALEQALALLHGQGLCQLEVRCAWLLARCDWLDRESDAALKHCLAAIDAALGTPLAFPPLASDLAWLAPRLALDGDDASAARVLRALVAWSSDETAPNADAERALLDAATQIVTLCAPELADSLLSDATGDLPRPRRALLEPFVLAARCGLSPREAVLLEQPDEMRRVVDDVLARADVIGRGPLPDPPWLHGSLLA